MNAPTLYRVIRFCCISGMCFECHMHGRPYGETRRTRVVHADNLSKAMAARMVSGWKDYEATAEPMATPIGFADSVAKAKGSA